MNGRGINIGLHQPDPDDRPPIDLQGLTKAQALAKFDRALAELAEVAAMPAASRAEYSAYWHALQAWYQLAFKLLLALLGTSATLELSAAWMATEHSSQSEPWEARRDEDVLRAVHLGAVVERWRRYIAAEARS